MTEPCMTAFDMRARRLFALTLVPVFLGIELVCCDYHHRQDYSWVRFRRRDGSGFIAQTSGLDVKSLSAWRLAWELLRAARAKNASAVDPVFGYVTVANEWRPRRWLRSPVIGSTTVSAAVCSGSGKLAVHVCGEMPAVGGLRDFGHFFEASIRQGDSLAGALAFAWGMAFRRNEAAPLDEPSEPFSRPVCPEDIDRLKAQLRETIGDAAYGRMLIERETALARWGYLATANAGEILAREASPHG